MQDNTLTLFFAAAVIGLLGLGVGAAIGFILAGLRAGTPAGTPAKEAMQRKNQAEVARIWRDRNSGRISVEMEGKMHYRRTDLSVRQRSVLTRLHDELQHWLGLEELPVGSPAAQTAVPTQAETPKTPSPAGRSGSPQSGEEIGPVGLDVGEILSRAIVPETPKGTPATFKSIAHQVNDIVQERLPETGLREHLIRLSDSPDGGILVVVDGQRFSGIPEVADPAVREFLQGCVAEWERRTSGD